MRTLKFAVFMLAVLLCSSCAVGPDYQSPTADQELRFSDIADQSQALEKGQLVDDQWWHSFADSDLDMLVQQAIASNQDIRAATGRVQEARAMRNVALAANRPTLSAQASGTRSQQSQLANFPPGIPTLFSLFDVGLAASWEPDLFGRIGRQTEAATAQFEASIEDRRSVLHMVLAEVALNYVDLRMAQLQLRLREEQVEIAEQSLHLTELLRGQELVAESTLLQARAEVNQRKAALASLEAAVRAPAVRLAVLTAKPPAQVLDSLLEPAADILVAPSIPVGLPSDLLRRRPDVRAAERRLAVASANLGQETASLFPQFQLTGGLSSNALELDNLFTGPSQAWELASILNWPIIDGGRRDAAIAAARARYEVAFAAYDQAVLDALGDAETAFASYVFAVKERETLQSVRRDLQSAVELETLRYESGLADRFALLDARDRLSALDAQLTTARRSELVAAVSVYRALGGGWATAEELLGTTE
ncbi:MAG: efflux transporter outer membrane subunit [Gammaproteobacteria bacterium]